MKRFVYEITNRKTLDTRVSPLFLDRLSRELEGECICNLIYSNIFKDEENLSTDDFEVKRIDNLACQGNLIKTLAALYPKDSINDLEKKGFNFKISEIQ